MKQLISCFLLLALLFSLAACAKSEGKDPADGGDTDTSAAQTDVTDTGGDFEPLYLPPLDYGGAKIRIVTENSAEDDGELLSEELTNEPINDAIYNRERFVEDLLSVELERDYRAERVSAYIEKTYISGDLPGDIICAPCDDNAWRTPSGYYRDLNTLDGINTKAVWWSQDFNDAISVCDTLYLTCGDLSLSMLRNIYVIFFNSDMARENGIDGVYDLVFDGGWTIDAATEISAGIYRDLNGNSECDPDDAYGFIVAPMTGDPCWRAFDINILSKDEDGFLTFEPDLDKFGLAFDRVCRLFDRKSSYCCAWVFSEPERRAFASGRALFASAQLMEAESMEFRNMQQDYGILPMPKFDREQKEYHTDAVAHYTSFGISSMLDDATAEMAAAVLEAMGWYSYRYVKPAYLDIAMKGKYANDPQTRRMLDIVVDGLRIDAAWMYAYTLSGYPQTWRDLLNDRSVSYASAFAAKERNVKIRLKELNDSFAALKNR